MTPCGILRGPRVDARTGDLIWEHATGPENGQDMRNIAIWHDKIIEATTDARLVALDARSASRSGRR